MNYYIFDREKDDLLRDDGERICFKSHVEVYNYLSKDCQFTNEFISSNYFIMRGEKILTVDSTDYSGMMPKDESPTTADASVLKEALEKIRDHLLGPWQTFDEIEEIVKEALAQYSTQSLPAPTANLVDQLRAANPYPEEKGFGAIDGWKFCCDKLEILLKQQS